MKHTFSDLIKSFMLVVLLFAGCGEQSAETDHPALSKKAEVLSATRDSTQYVFFKALRALQGQAFSGKITAGPPNDTAFAGKPLTMHVRSAEDSVIRIPFFVGNDSSRTWILRWKPTGIELKHDHRHADGTPDSITFYGGTTANFGSATRQVFPADQETAVLLPAAIGNVWWIDLLPGESFSYNLRRVNTDRVFTVVFDLKTPLATPGKPWGWSD